jgi:hypothetical protein
MVSPDSTAVRGYIPGGHTDKIDDSIGDTESTGGFDTASNILYLSMRIDV